MRHTNLPEELGSVFSVARARAHGVGRGRLSGADLGSTFRGARRRGEDAEPAQGDEPEAARQRARVLTLAHEYAQVMTSHAFFAGMTSAVIQGIPLPPEHYWEPVAPDAPLTAPRKPRPLVVGVHAPRTPVRRPGIRGIRIGAELAPLATAEGLPVVAGPATWASLGAELSERDLVIAADHLIRIPRHPGGFKAPDRSAYATCDQLAAAIGVRRGAAKLRAALARARTGSSSPKESALRLILVDGGLPEPVQDHDVYDAGQWIATLDLAYPELRIGIEYDGSGHRTQVQFEKDVRRLERLAEAGWTILRFTARDLRGAELAIVQRVARARTRLGG
jgi:very-short-patch-repair endonuclease